MVTLCSVLAWRIPWTEGPGGLQSMGHERTQTHRRGDGPQRRDTHAHAHVLPTSLEDGGLVGAGLVLGRPLGGLPSITGSPASWPHGTSGAQQVSPASCQCFLSPLSHHRWGPFLWKPLESSLASTSWKNMTPTPCASPANLASPSTFPTSLRRCCGRERPLLGGDLVRKSLEGF